MSKQSFDEWVLTHPDNLDLTKYEENIMRDAWQQAQKVAVPDGWVVVPKEPTQKIIDAFPEVEYEDTYTGACSIWVDDQTLKIGYKAMIEAGEKND